MVTEETSHALISELNVVLSLKRLLISVTALVSHPLISPYVVVAVASSEIHKSTAVCILLFVMGRIKKLAVTGSDGLYSVLKAVAIRNIWLKSVTLLTSQLRISLSNTEAL